MLPWWQMWDTKSEVVFLQVYMRLAQLLGQAPRCLKYPLRALFIICHYPYVDYSVIFNQSTYNVCQLVLVMIITYNTANLALNSNHIIDLYDT